MRGTERSLVLPRVNHTYGAAYQASCSAMMRRRRVRGRWPDALYHVQDSGAPPISSMTLVSLWQQDVSPPTCARRTCACALEQALASRQDQPGVFAPRMTDNVGHTAILGAGGELGDAAGDVLIEVACGARQLALKSARSVRACVAHPHLIPRIRARVRGSRQRLVRRGHCCRDVGEARTAARVASRRIGARRPSKHSRHTVRVAWGNLV